MNDTTKATPATEPTQGDRLAQELHEAETKAVDALGRYKFTMFGYWAGIWVHLNKIEGKKRPSPFRQYVIQAKADSDAAKRDAQGTTRPKFDSSAGASGTIPANW